MKALVIVDIQNDFLPGGSLAVESGNEIIPLVNQLQPCFDLVITTQDWHPPEHRSFAKTNNKVVGDIIDLDGTEQVMWPVHCVEGSFGAEFASSLDLTSVAHVTRKGCNINIDSYSCFFDNKRKQKTDLDDYLRKEGVTELFLVGLATDYCVKFSALDAVDLGYDVKVIIDACRGVNLKGGDVDAAIEEMRSHGVEILSSDIFLTVDAKLS